MPGPSSILQKGKRKRNFGQKYWNVCNKEVECKKLGPPCGCKRDCREKAQGTEIEKFNNFYYLATYGRQTKLIYLFSNASYQNNRRVIP